MIILLSALSALFNTLDPLSVSQALAFYELYPESQEGGAALARAGQLLRSENIGSLPYLIHKGGSFSEEEIIYIESLAAHLPNRCLKGYRARNESEVQRLESGEIDLGKALILSQLDDLHEARVYSAKLDLMALQILARLPANPSAEEKIAEINRFIFDEMHFRFPPQSVYAENIDLYTFLPSVMDNHLGVCLGVTALYLTVAQRLDLPLEIVTPPGHIYLAYRDQNIETTARGIDLPSETYLSVNTRCLQKRTLKEVIGMTHFNQASVYLHSAQFDKAAHAYEKALPYMPEDAFLKELLGFSYILIGKKQEGEALLREVRDVFPEYAIAKSKMADDYLSGRVDIEGIAAVFMLVDETRESILEKQKRLEKVLESYPEYRDGLHQLAVSWIQLHRAKEGLAVLERYHAIDPEDPVVEYYLAVLHGERNDFKSCWQYLKNAEVITAKRDFSPKALRELRRVLTQHCPE